MRAEAKTIESMSRQYRELESTCSLWIAVSEAKDQRIVELTGELDQLRLRVARLSRRLERGSKTGPSRKVHHAR
jgi:hypothetical protein